MRPVPTRSAAGRRRTPTLLLTAALATLPARSFAWGDIGHRAIAELARRHIAAATRAHIVALLGNDDLAAVSNWADDIRGAARHEGPLVNDAAVQAFNARFPHNDHWHYTSLPLGAASYDPASPFASHDDIVQAIERCIASLEAPASRAEIPHGDALRVLVHLVGDLHQPLHVAEGYYRTAPDGGVLSEPNPPSPAGFADDRGANALHFDHNRLHAYWDLDLVDHLAAGRPSERFADDLARIAAPADPSGPLATWPRAWTAEMLAAARGAYDGIVIVRTGADRTYGTYWDIALPTNYEARSLPVVRELLARSGYRLASVLDHLHWGTEQ